MSVSRTCEVIFCNTHLIDPIETIYLTKDIRGLVRVYPESLGKEVVCGSATTIQGLFDAGMVAIKPMTLCYGWEGPSFLACLPGGAFS